MIETPSLEGWIDEVVNDDGDGPWVFGRYANANSGFVLHILDVPECQRVDLQPGMYCTFVNGNHLLIHKTFWTTHDRDMAKARADKWVKALNWD